MLQMSRPIGFYKKNGKTRPITKSRGLKHAPTYEPRTNARRQSSTQPKTARQAANAIAKRQIPVQSSPALQNEYDRVNRECFKGKIPEATIMLADLPNVKHRAFAIPDAKVIVINTDKCKTIEEQKYDLRHEMIHIAGIKGHGTMFQLYADMIKAPVSEYQGKSISSKEYNELKWKKEEVRQKEVHDKNFQYYKRISEKTGKPVAWIIMYSGQRGVVVPKGHMTPDKLPKYIGTRFREIDIAVPDFGTGKTKSVLVSRDELKQYEII